MFIKSGAFQPAGGLPAAVGGAVRMCLWCEWYGLPVSGRAVMC